MFFSYARRLHDAKVLVTRGRCNHKLPLAGWSPWDRMERQTSQEITWSHILPEISVVTELQWVSHVKLTLWYSDGYLPENSSSIQTYQDLAIEKLAVLKDHNFHLCLNKHLLQSRCPRLLNPGLLNIILKCMFL